MNLLSLQSWDLHLLLPLDIETPGSQVFRLRPDLRCIHICIYIHIYQYTYISCWFCFSGQPEYIHIHDNILNSTGMFTMKSKLSPPTPLR